VSVWAHARIFGAARRFYIYNRTSDRRTPGPPARKDQRLLLNRAWLHRRVSTMRRIFPNATCRARNAVALAAWYGDRARRNLRPEAEAYDATFWDFHDTGDWTGFARVVLRLFPSASVVDIGCGHGLALQGLLKVDPTLKLRGFDDSPTAVMRARARRLPVSPLDIVALTRSQARAFAEASEPFDLALCLEVAEHLPAWHSGKLLDTLTCARRLIFSAAHPNQGGIRHVNERAASYWIARLAERGFHLSEADDRLRAEVAALSLAPWYKENIHAFEKAR
jgi:SAM-dependent methyltransferase